ncbi:MAG: lipoprotein [Sideroxydans sp.]
MVPPPAVAEKTAFPPPFSYLRMEISGRVVFLASDTPDAGKPGVTETWYSAGREVLRMRDGRLIAAVGMRQEWRAAVIPPLPDWDALVAADGPVRWVRKRDLMPGYRFGVEDALVLQKIAPPARSALKGLAADTLVWFEERFEHAEAREALPVARYAVQRGAAGARVVYGEQCISAGECYAWQRWPVRGAAQ